ncbi:MULTISPECIES: acetate/propionate family kinase [unclassified Bradyrhizobium]|uniref:acetate/propionate family kinase n=1 Tax=unclassified Bradyrhizobium TaxID=2631580 RepID=UPI0028EA778C|nr:MULTISPECIES: acetate/propionate family kinase [unclassified Bradyrhizobium]
MTDVILTVNAGSSSIKFAAYEIGAGALRAVARGHIDDIGDDTTFEAGPAGGPAEMQPIDAPRGTVDHGAALLLAIDWLRQHEQGFQVVAIGHRVVHGGPDYAEPVVIDADTLQRLRQFVPLAPLHQPHNLAGVAAALQAFPDAAQVACFDTAFHRQHPFIADTFGLPRRLYDEGVRRYGFHGLSYEYVSRRLRSVAPDLASGRVIIAHLGNGASVCALRDGRSIASTMGFTALDGLPMGTRCGQLDPGVVLYLLTEKGMSADEITHMLYHDSGLRGLSGLSNDMRELEASDAPEAREAIDYFVARVRREIAGLAATIGGVDAIVFAGGIGEHAWHVREQILGDMAWLGIALDREANAGNAQTVSQPGSRVTVLVIPTDEDRMIAEHTAEILGLMQAPADSMMLTRLTA